MPKRPSDQLNCVNNKKKVWLVKVPRYVSAEWQKRGAGAEVGRLKVLANQDVVLESVGGSSESSTGNGSGRGGQTVPTAGPSSSSSGPSSARARAVEGMNAQPLGRKADAGPAKVPKEHRFVVSDLGPQTLAVYSEEPLGPEEEEESGGTGHLALEGTIVKRAELRPPANAAYLRLKAEAFEKASRPTRSVLQLDRAANKFKPVNSHAEDAARAKVKKSDVGKNVRIEKDQMMSMVLSAFEKHQYYKLNDLAAVLQQPLAYVREILNEVGSYCNTPPHRNMWELREEYRHYAPSNEPTSD